MLIFLCGKGGSGKDTLMNEVLSDRGDIERLVLYTTRPIREGEENGVTYNFIDNDKFDSMKSCGFFLETRSYDTAQGTWKYGTSIGVRNIEKVYLTVGPYGQYKSLKALLNESMIGIYLDTSVSNCVYRMLGRSGSDEEIIESCRRAYADSIDYKDLDISNFDYVIDTNFNSIEEEKSILNGYIDSILKDKAFR